ncbi:methylmalonyl-CoA mutase family protein [Candidatus Uabimicrobium sp. HlEnr_7]|uniref:methylmalonyl-CoA mutase family protein n=1 Tax=Candidatus Uabimicrobium helgolandensis TaxID=3095367 RepID=UPI003556A9C9
MQTQVEKTHNNVIPEKPKIYQPQNKIRMVTAASLFDGHDVSINIMRRMLQASGAEIIHLGHNRSVGEIVNCAIQEGVQGIAITSYQGGHVEYLKYMYDLLKQNKAGHIKIFAGGGGTILPSEIEELHKHGVCRIYSPDDGRAMGLQGMINDVLEKCDFPTGRLLQGETNELYKRNSLALGNIISAIENKNDTTEKIFEEIEESVRQSKVPILGVTGTGGAGKSSVVDEFVRRFLNDFSDKNIAIICVDPSKRKTGGALLGDRIRMNAIDTPRVFMRSMATRQAHLALNENVGPVIDLYKAAKFDLIILETAGIGQSDSAITEFVDASLYVMTPEYGAATQLEKIDMIDYANVVALNKFDKRGALDALRDVKKQYQRAHNLFTESPDNMPVFGTIASQFNDPGMNQLYRSIIELLIERTGVRWQSKYTSESETSKKVYIIPPERNRYLAEICDEVDRYNSNTQKQAEIACDLYKLSGAKKILGENSTALDEEINKKELLLSPEVKSAIEHWETKKQKYREQYFSYTVRNKEIKVENYTTSLSNLPIPKIAVPRFQDWRDIVTWTAQENFPGEFPFTAGVFPFKRKGEDPTRMFAGEGGPERTNRRFHYLSKGMPAARLSTAFDSVTLYGEDPAHRPDIYGKIGNSGVSIATLNDAKKLYSGFDLCSPKTSVSMTINGPAPILLSFFLNAAIDQMCEKYILENGLQEEVQQKIASIYEQKNMSIPQYSGDLPEGNDGLGLMLLGVTGDEVLPSDIYQQLKAQALNSVRGTVQADILKEDQAQNTCIFSTEFALRLMGDVQEYFINNKVRNFYSVSISGYHIAEAGANPITQLAFTLSNGFTFVEYYLSRGMNINDFAPNFSFFFSNGIDPEYSVIGRVARRIWAKTIKMKYNGNKRSQMLKYHIQTSGRSLHAQEIGFNDIRTTLQALYAIYDNCNSLHTNAYDEAITTPTEESVRRAMAIQLIINRELGLAKNENPLQGAFIIEELTDLVEEAVITEFRRISERGGVLGAMEKMYQRSKIQEESMHYEHLKHTGEYPIVGVNMFLDSQGSPTIIPQEVIRSTSEEKEKQIKNVAATKKRSAEKGKQSLQEMQATALNQENIFASLMEAAKCCSLGQISNALYDVGGQYRRNM